MSHLDFKVVNLIMSNKETYKGKKIEVKTENNHVNLFIEDKLIQIQKDREAEIFYSNQVPYIGFSSLTKLAMAIIDKQGGD